MESLSYFKNIKVSPKKMRFLMPQIKKLKPAVALDYLFYMPDKTAEVFYKAIHSAIANAKNTLKVNDDMLQFKLLTIEQGQALKRYRAGSRGTAKPIKRRFSHIKIILEQSVIEDKKSAVLSEPKKEKETTSGKEEKKTTKKVAPEKKVKKEPTVKKTVKKVKTEDK